MNIYYKFIAAQQRRAIERKEAYKPFSTHVRTCVQCRNIHNLCEEGQRIWDLATQKFPFESKK